MKKIVVAWVLCTYLLFSCTGKPALEAHDHAHETGTEAEAHGEEHVHDHEHEGEDHAHDHGAESGNSSEINFSAEKAKAVGLKTIVLEPGSFTSVIKTSGRIQAAQGEETVLVATMSGVVSLEKTALTEGAAVRKGQSILSISSRNLSEGDQLTKIKAAYEAAEKEYLRSKELVPLQIVSEKDFNAARLNYENAKAAYDAVAGKQTAGGVAVTATLSGFLKNLQVKEGDYVQVGQPVAVVSQNNRLVLRAEVPEKQYKHLSQVRSANFKTPYDDQVYALSELNGRLLSYGKSTDNNSFYIPVTFEFDNKGAVIPGSYVEVFLLTSELPGVLSVPVSSLVESQGIYFVFTRLDETCYLKKEVTPGAGNGVSVQILSGLSAGDEVVTEGAYQLKLASASGAIPAHTHNH